MSRKRRERLPALNHSGPDRSADNLWGCFDIFPGEVLLTRLYYHEHEIQEDAETHPDVIFFISNEDPIDGGTEETPNQENHLQGPEATGAEAQTEG